MVSQTLRERFDEKYCPEPNTGCWLWTASATNHGYGFLNRASGSRAAHRISWELHRGNLPPGVQVLHKCDTPACVNPEHLFLGSIDDNMADRAAKGRTAHGTRIGSSKLSDEQVMAIRAAAGSQREIGRRFGVSGVSVHRIKRGHSRKSVV